MVTPAHHVDREVYALSMQGTCGTVTASRYCYCCSTLELRDVLLMLHESTTPLLEASC